MMNVEDSTGVGFWILIGQKMLMNFQTAALTAIRSCFYRNSSFMGTRTAETLLILKRCPIV